GGGVEGGGKEGMEVGVRGGEGVEEGHGGATAGTRPRRPRRRGRRRFGCRGRRDDQGLTALHELRRAAPRGEEAEVADADEARREDVQQEAAEKLVDGEGERSDGAAVPVVPPGRTDGSARR